jgi:hypothetical protein
MLPLKTSCILTHKSKEMLGGKENSHQVGKIQDLIALLLGHGVFPLLVAANTSRIIPTVAG